MRASWFFNRVSAYPLIRRSRITPLPTLRHGRPAVCSLVRASTHTRTGHVSAFAFSTQELRARRQDRRHRMFNSRYVRVSSPSERLRERKKESTEEQDCCTDGEREREREREKLCGIGVRAKSYRSCVRISES